MNTKLVYLFDKECSVYRGIFIAQENPARPGTFILPECFTETEPLPPKEGFDQIYNVSRDGWDYIELPKEPDTSPTDRELTIAKANSNIINILGSNIELMLSWIADQESSPRELRVARSQIAEQREILKNVGA